MINHSEVAEFHGLKPSFRVVLEKSFSPAKQMTTDRVFHIY